MARDLKVLRWAQLFQPLLLVGTQLRGDDILLKGLGFGDGHSYGNGRGGGTGFGFRNPLWSGGGGTGAGGNPLDSGNGYCVVH